jgi:hypothetical protein
MTVLISLIILSGDIAVSPLDIAGVQILGVQQLQSNGKNLVLRCSMSTQILEVDGRGTLKRSVGRKSASHYQQHPLTFQVLGDDSYAILYDRDMVLYRAEDEEKLFRVLWPIDPTRTANAIGWDGKRLVVPAHPRFNVLGLVFGLDGKEVAKLGKIKPIVHEELMQNPALNDTLWAAGGGHYYGLHKYFPVLEQYDADTFEKTAHWDLAIDGLQRQSMETPLLTDIKWYDGALYLMHYTGTLYRASGGEVTGRWTFKRKESPSAIPFTTFALGEGGQIYLGHPYLKWGHDLWQGTLK